MKLATSHDLAEALASTSVRVLDVRTPAEFETLHIDGAYHVPLDRLAAHADDLASLNEPVVLVCASGQRARAAADTLTRAGVSSTPCVLDGGLNAWVAAGLPVVRGRARMSLERQVRIAAGTLAGAGGFLALLANPWFALLPALVGSGLVFSGVTDTCGMARVLAKLPYNRPASCDAAAMVRALTTGQRLQRSGEPS